MLGDTTPPRRRKLPVLGMTTVGLAVGAGSLGLYRGAAAVPLGPPDQPTWTTAEVRTPPPRPEAEPVTLAAAESPVTPPPVLPTLPPLPDVPAPAQGPTPKSEPTPWPPLPRPAEGPPSPAPIMPVTPAGPLLPLMPSLGVPDPVKPVETPPIPVTVAASEVAPPPRQHPQAAAVEAKPVAPPAQAVQLASPARPIVPEPADFPLPPPQPGFSVNGRPEAPPAKATPGALTSLKVEHPGEPPVTPTLQALKAAALGLALAAAPVSAADPPAVMPKSDAAKDVVADLKREFEKMREDVNTERKYRELMEDAVKGKLNKETNKTEPGLVTKFGELDARLKRLESALEKLDATKLEAAMARLEKKLNELETTTAQKPEVASKPMPGPSTGSAIVGAKATVRIVNEYPVPISMMVNGSSHRVEPSASKSVDVPAGAYTYELLHAGSQATTATIKENDSVTLRIK